MSQEQMSFEQSLARLDAITRQMEQGNVPLEQALALFQEMLRVLKPGAAFVIQDTYFDKRVYGDINAFVEQLRPRVKEIHFEDTRKPDYAPRFLNTPLVLGQMGVIWGRK